MNGAGASGTWSPIGLPPGGPTPLQVEPEELRAPIWMLGVALAAVAISAALLAATGDVANLVGYFLATVVTVLAVGLYRRTDSSRRSRPTYVVPQLAQTIPPHVIAWGCLIVGFGVAMIHVYRFAEAVARR